MKLRILRIFVMCALATVTALPVLAQKKEAPPPQMWPTSRVMAAPCDAVWPAALRVVTENGWAVKASDRAGGIMTLDWTKGEQLGRAKFINPMVGQHTVEKSTGFWTQYTGFRIAGATLTLIPGKETCDISANAVYHGYEIRAGQGGNWWILKTNGWFEDKMLGEIEAKIPK